MLDPPDDFRAIAAEYVCARVTDVQSLDLGRFRFDYDLTLAALLLHPDGTVYHRFGGREVGSATKWTSVAALARVMRATLPEHRAHVALAETAEASPSRDVWDIPVFAQRVERAKQECVHCHTLHEAERDQARADGRFDRERDLWIWPAPARVGLALDALDQALVTAVGPDSPAARAGVLAGDRLLRAGAQRVLTIHDLQFALHEAEWGPTELALELERAGESHTVKLALVEGWKRESPLAYSWRPYKWDLGPQPGFGGPELTPDEKRALGLEPDDFAMRVTYLIDWGPRAESGRRAARAGLRVGDVVLSLDGERDFASEAHLQSWFRLTREPGTTCKLEVLRDSKPLALDLPVGARE